MLKTLVLATAVTALPSLVLADECNRERRVYVLQGGGSEIRLKVSTSSIEAETRKFGT